MAGEEVPPDTETTCSVCYAEFLDPEDLALHTSQVHEVNIVQCDFCPSTFRSVEDYALHIRNIHILLLKVCKHCTKVFTNFNLFKNHENKHKMHYKKIACSQCPIRFTNDSELQQHEWKMHNNNIDGVLLNKCLPNLSSILNIKAVDFIQSLGSDAAYICTKCVYTSPSASEYLHHLNISNCVSFACNTCCNVYKERKGLAKHLEKHKECWHIAGRYSKKICSKCQKNISIQSYSEHVKKCKPIKCNLCNIILNSMEDLSFHQSTEHPMAITMMKCKFCHSEFVGNTALQKHIDRKHKAEMHLYKYKCVYCDGLYFKHPQKLFCHFFSKHVDLQPYSCNICHETFRVRKKFTIHIKLTHNSIGFVEFDERYHVYFSDKKSENPFVPRCLFSDELEKSNLNNTEVDRNDFLNEETDAPTDYPTDVPTDVPTDAQTDTEEIKRSASQRKPPKIRFKEQEKSRLLTAKEEMQSEGNQTENELLVKKAVPKKTRASKRKKGKQSDDTDTEDEPLIKIKRRSLKKRGVKKFNTIKSKKHTKISGGKSFICKICKQNCYTYQNYNHHMSFHYKNEIKKCIKCSKQFTSATALKKHITEQHTTSKLTETLKTLIERRKVGKDGAAPEMPTSEKFKRTIKQIKFVPTLTAATITELQTGDELSAKNFLETFTPEEREESMRKERLNINTCVSVKKVPHNMVRPPKIKMTKFVSKPPPTTVKLAMPVRFKTVSAEKTKIKVKIIQNVNMNDDADMVDYEQEIDYDYEVENPSRNEIVPEVAQEVMLESQDQQNQTYDKKPCTPMPHKIIIPKLPKHCDNKDVKIAHLLPVAPFYKIVKMTDVIGQQYGNGGEEKQIKVEEPSVKLPGGTKLVNVNPLAHLIGNTPVEKIIGPSNKHYKSKTEKKTDFEKAIANALLKLEQAPYTKKKNTKKKNEELVEAVTEELDIEQ